MFAVPVIRIISTFSMEPTVRKRIPPFKHCAVTRKSQKWYISLPVLLWWWVGGSYYRKAGRTTREFSFLCRIHKWIPFASLQLYRFPRNGPFWEQPSRCDYYDIHRLSSKPPSCVQCAISRGDSLREIARAWGVSVSRTIAFHSLYFYQG